MKLTKEQGIILTGYLGHLCCIFSDFHEDVEKRIGRPVWTHEFGNKKFADELKDLYRDDFLSIIPEGTLEKQATADYHGEGTA